MMPYGLPGAIKLDADTPAQRLDDGKAVCLRSGSILAPLCPAADQDGFDGHWICENASTWETVAIAGEFLPAATR